MHWWERGVAGALSGVEVLRVLCGASVVPVWCSVAPVPGSVVSCTACASCPEPGRTARFTARQKASTLCTLSPPPLQDLHTHTHAVHTP